MRFALALVTGLLLLAVSPISARAADTAKAQAFVQQMSGQALEVVRQPDMPYAQAYQAFDRIFSTGFDVPTIGQFVLGRYWRTATEPQKREYMELFRKFVVKTYTDRFRQYNGEKFEVTGARAVEGGDVLVDSRIVSPSGRPPVSVGWRVRDRSGQMKVIDVILENLSMSQNQQSEFQSVISQNGGDVEALLKKLRAQ